MTNTHTVTITNVRSVDPDQRLLSSQAECTCGKVSRAFTREDADKLGSTPLLMAEHWQARHAIAALDAARESGRPVRIQEQSDQEVTA